MNKARQVAGLHSLCIPLDCQQVGSLVPAGLLRSFQVSLVLRTL